MRRKLSAIEHMIDGNIVYFVRLEGTLGARTANSWNRRRRHFFTSLRISASEDVRGLRCEFRWRCLRIGVVGVR
jgi:hypothetical protein